MAKIALKKKTVSESTSLVSEIRHYARQIWLAGLGAYSRLGTEGSYYFKELVKAGEALEKKGKSLVTSQVDSANDSVKTGLSSVKGKVEDQLDRIEQAFDSRVASTLNRIGIPSRNDVEALSAKLDELSAVLERVARTQ
ncbi:phasin family protein [Pseudomonas aeruginosa]|uniref:phasin family protein n=1 Tax=Pseudomonas aeruginosa TaxID=287 RepID=UPI000F52DA01|nr:phasin family protein [Pseudomonas aeruginosa]RPU06305.1 poly(3-hydroxyalkanoate) granule-associated protein PhaI [Pseudomonas aeruginosa]RPU41250.1 poly(3-hydroxyalkanoate) granule-associated protein PhaI [Pseudomonas aeruginosa]RPU54257.1 poly(3-hydroxyalkanoate) granule-associated protein PhaI [Pseudomonas aeruginosa]UJG30333.1 phasin family protein [Pseudomonas aeruginosa]